MRLFSPQPPLSQAADAASFHFGSYGRGFSQDRVVEGNLHTGNKRRRSDAGIFGDVLYLERSQLIPEIKRLKARLLERGSVKGMLLLSSCCLFVCLFVWCFTDVTTCNNDDIQQCGDTLQHQQQLFC